MSRNENTLINSSHKLLENEFSFFRSLLGISEPGQFELSIKKDISKLLETRPIQALKRRYQLGLLHKVSKDWSGVKHTRYEHTVGVVAKCIISCDIINNNSRNNNNRLSEIDVRELAVAAALHDCGHLPISHAVERAFLASENLSGISHEERIIPLIVNQNQYFQDLRETVLSWEGFDSISFYRVACIINPFISREHLKDIDNFRWPKRAIQQLLVSQLDMDRLDYIIRDSEALSYTPVTLLKQSIVQFVHGLSLEESNFLSKRNPTKTLELVLDSGPNKKYLESVFNLLVSRVLLYKYIFFSEKVRSFEAVLTYLVGIFIEKKIALDPLNLIAMSDDYFIQEYLEELVEYIEDETQIADLKRRYIHVLKKEKVKRFKHQLSIYSENISNPRLCAEFKANISKRSYLENLRNQLFSQLEDIQRNDILLDVFYLKTGGGDLLVKHKGKKCTLKDFMNGSNMHRLCSELRLDLYIKTDLSENKIHEIDQITKNFFDYVETEQTRTA